MNERLDAAVLEHRLGRLPEARRAYQQILVVEPANAASLHLLGLADYQQGRAAPGAILMRRSVFLSPGIATWQSNLALSLRDLGKVAESASSLQRALVVDPGLADGWSNLATIFVAKGEAAWAERACHRAIRSHPLHGEALCCLGSILNESGLWDQSVVASQAALVARPDDAVAMANLGVGLRWLRRRGEAKTAYERALAIKAMLAAPLINLGELAIAERSPKDAIRLCRLAVVTHPDISSSYANLSTAYLDAGDVAGCLAFTETRLRRLVQSIQAFSPELLPVIADQIQNLTSNLLVCRWLQGKELGTSAGKRNETQCYLSFAKKGRKKNSSIYIEYVTALEGERRNEPALYTALSERLYVIGESHSLSPAHVRIPWLGRFRQGEAVFFPGIKMFHLGRSGGRESRENFKRRLYELGTRPHLLIVIGEIDCRPDEGLWPAHKKLGMSVESLAEKTVNEYLEWLWEALAGRDAGSVTIQGIPAPAYPLAEFNDASERQRFLSLLKLVNAELRQGANKRGWYFLDVDLATANAEGTSNGRWHIDSHHLKPAFYARCEEWLIAP